ncbi:YchJ family metal-binding protein [Luteimonas sp. MJ246]|uniref:YchJ family protein n=1 Tax=Luteimonas sp. MJ174 TaxID=3129237 RepID=UPI0031BB96B9
MASPCPCNANATYEACCKPLHDGAPADTADALMRSRYSAYVLGLRDYVAATWHPSTRPVPFELDATPSLRWLGLEVRRHAQLGDDEAVVEFVARYKPGSAPAVRLHEISRFERVDGRWLYVDGDFPK